MLWLYINFPSLQLDSLQVSKGKCVAGQQLTDSQAIVIVDEHKNSIVQLNASAIKQGVKVAMGLAMAASLADELCVFPYKIAQEEAYLMTLAEQLYSVSANIALFPPHGLALQVDNMLKLYQNLEHYVEAVHSVITPFKLKAFFACGYSPFSAQVLACADINLISSEKKTIAAAMSVLSVEDLFISKKAREDIIRLGIKTIAQLQALPISELATRLDTHTMDYLSQLNGNKSKCLTFYQAQHFFEHSVDLLYEITVSDVLLHPIKQLLLLLEAFLLRRDYLCLEIKLALFNRAEGPSDAIQQSLLISSATGEYLAKQWLNLMSLKLANVKLDAPITKINLCVKKFQPNTGEIDDIFLGRKGQLSLAQLSSLLVNKLGHNKVLGIRLGNDHRAELASHYFPIINHGAINSIGNKSDKKHQQSKVTQAISHSTYSYSTCSDSTIDCLPLRPSFILSEPEPLLAEVNILSGPERIETAWWEQSSLKYQGANATVDKPQSYPRDYFVAKNAQGQCCWIYRELSNHWYVHGYFS